MWRNVLVAEIPQPGRATYLFAKPDNQDDFLERYTKLTREDMVVVRPTYEGGEALDSLDLS